MLIAAALLCLLQTVGMMMLWCLNRRLPGMIWWTTSALFYALCTPLFAIQNELKYPVLMYVLPNGLNVAAAAFFYVGSCRFSGRNVRKRLLLPVLAVFALAFLYFTFVDQNQAMRIHLMSTVMGFTYALSAVTLWRQTNPGLRFSARFTAGAFAVCTGWMIYRLVALWGFMSMGAVFNNSLPNMLLISFGLVMTYLWTFCIVLMINQYQACKIEERMTAQFLAEEELLKARHEVEKQRSLRMRQLVVRDLHDGIGGITATLAMLASVGRDDEGEEREELMRHIEMIAIEGNREVRALMNTLEKGAFEWGDWLRDLLHYSEKTLDATGVKLVSKTEGEVPEGTIGDTVAAISLMRTVKEAVNNIARHAGASLATLVLEFSAEWLAITISDDGKGYEGPRKGGRGMDNMQRRIDELYGTFAIDRNVERGTRISIGIPVPLHSVEEEQLG